MPSADREENSSGAGAPPFDHAAADPAGRAMLDALSAISKIGPDKEPEDQEWENSEHAFNCGAEVAYFECASVARTAIARARVLTPATAAAASAMLGALKRMRAITYQHISPACQAADEAIAAAEAAGIRTEG